MTTFLKVLKYVDKAIEDPEYGAACQRIKAEAYENMKDTANWISNLMTGIVNYPTDEYFYTKIIMYYNDTEKWEELEGFVTDMIDKDQIDVPYLEDIEYKDLILLLEKHPEKTNLEIFNNIPTKIPIV